MPGLSLLIDSIAKRFLLACIAGVMLVPVVMAADLAVALRETATLRDVSTDEVLERLDRLQPLVAAAKPHLQREYEAQRGEVLLEGGYLREADSSIGRLLTAAERANDPQDRVRALVLRARLGFYKGDTVLQMTSASEAETLAKSMPGKPWSVLAADAMGIALYVRSRYAESARVLQQAAMEAAKVGDPVLLGRIYLTLSSLNIHIGDNPRALHYVNQARAQIEPTGQRWLRAQIECNGGLVSGRPEDTGEDYAALQRALVMVKKYRMRRAELAVLVSLSDWHLVHRAWPEAIATAREAVALSRRFDGRAFTGLALLNLGQGLVNIGRVDEGVAVLERARDRVREADDYYHLAPVLIQLAQGYEKAGRLSEALATHKDFFVAHEVLDREGKSKLVAELQERFDSQSRQREIERLEAQNAIKSESAEHHRQIALFWSLVAGLLLIGIGVVLAFYRSTRRANCQLANANGRLAYLAERDTLSGLFNRRAMSAWIETLQPTPSLGSPLGLILIDIDHFKSVNDRHTHAGGDAVLVEFSTRISHLLRDTDRLARWGGEEFLIGVRGVDAFQLPGLVQRILDSISETPFTLPNGPLMVTASIGYVSYPLAFDAIEDGWEYHLTLADQALYLAKEEGRNAAFGIIGGTGCWLGMRESLNRNFRAAFFGELLFSRRYFCREGEAVRINPDASRSHAGSGCIIPFPRDLTKAGASN